MYGKIVAFSCVFCYFLLLFAWLEVVTAIYNMVAEVKEIANPIWILGAFQCSQIPLKIHAFLLQARCGGRTEVVTPTLLPTISASHPLVSPLARRFEIQVDGSFLQNVGLLYQ